MSEMVEKLARVIGAAYDGYVDPEATPYAWASAVATAREVLEAMREPTKAMLEVAWDTNSVGHEENAELWRCMIDVALQS